MKPSNWISGTGRIPDIASPMDVPMMPDSESGVFDDAIRTEPLLQAIRHAEHAAIHADILAQHDDALVGRHLLHQGRADRLDKVKFGHVNLRAPPSIGRQLRMIQAPGSAGGVSPIWLGSWPIESVRSVLR